MPPLAERLNPKSPHYDAKLAELRKRAYASYEADKRERPERYADYPEAK